MNVKINFKSGKNEVITVESFDSFDEFTDEVLCREDWINLYNNGRPIVVRLDAIESIYEVDNNYRRVVINNV